MPNDHSSTLSKLLAIGKFFCNQLQLTFSFIANILLFYIYFLLNEIFLSVLHFVFSNSISLSDKQGILATS